MDGQDEQDLRLTLAKHAQFAKSMYLTEPRTQNRVASMQINATLYIFYSFQPEIPFYYLLSRYIINRKRSLEPGANPQNYNQEQL